MPRQVTLTHCEPRQIYPPPPAEPGPPTVDLDVSILSAGASGDGVVEIHQDAPDGPIVASVDTGDTGGGEALGTQGVWLHYVRNDPMDPDTIDVEYDHPAP